MKQASLYDGRFCQTASVENPSDVSERRRTVAPVTSVLTALVTGLLAGALPMLLTSRRRRTLKLLTEEAETLERVKDDTAREYLTDALRKTASDYQFLVASEQKKSALVHARRFGPYVALVFANGLLYTFMATLIEDKGARATVNAVATSLLLVGSFGFLLLALWVLDEQRTNRRSRSKKR